MHRSAIVLIIPLLLVLATGEASAHALLDHAEPRVGNAVATAPREVTLWFTQKLEPAFSSITVTNSVGQRVDAGLLDGARHGAVRRVSSTGIRQTPGIERGRSAVNPRESLLLREASRVAGSRK